MFPGGVCFTLSSGITGHCSEQRQRKLFTTYALFLDAISEKISPHCPALLRHFVTIGTIIPTWSGESLAWPHFNHLLFVIADFVFVKDYIFFASMLYSLTKKEHFLLLPPVVCLANELQTTSRLQSSYTTLVSRAAKLLMSYAFCYIQR